MLSKKFDINNLFYIPLTYFYYIEAKYSLITSKLGTIKFKFLNGELLKNKNYLYWNNIGIYKKSMIKTFFNITSLFFFSITYGHVLKYKVIGLGHRGYYSKNILLYKIGYSHLIFCFLPYELKSKKKKKKKKYHKLYSLNITNLTNFFFKIQNMRIPDIYNKNGIYNRTDFFIFKKGKKSFLL